MIKVAYVKENIDCDDFIIKEGSVFIVDKRYKNVLHGFWKGGTSMIKRLDMEFKWYFEGKLSYYEVSRECLCCKYADYVDGGCGCNREMCYHDEV